MLRAGHTIILVARRAELARAVEYLTAEAKRQSDTPLAEMLRKVDFLAPLNDESPCSPESRVPRAPGPPRRASWPPWAATTSRGW
ncbi:MAG TPA: hypothetical protein VFZ09_14510 [Archangium sp.]|uniref:hypothetical protein n=1 Tax=Archangium sp. TaxID=1872627 RepID=UPI002E2EBBEA|nr:hypothetical protein [Archangium sp.]HEX5747454.1 hypothetical protein [Archangium sp.]